VDGDIMSRHISMIKEKGLGQALQHFSGQTLSTTLHPRPHLLTNPPQRHPTLPVHPHPALMVRLSEEQQSCLADHQVRILPPPMTDPPLPIEVTMKTQQTLGSFTLAMTFEERLHELAVQGDRYWWRMILSLTTESTSHPTQRMWHLQGQLRYTWRRTNGRAE
jgi:hypothetical protein